jgi:hypothetical protein
MQIWDPYFLEFSEAHSYKDAGLRDGAKECYDTGVNCWSLGLKHIEFFLLQIRERNKWRAFTSN